MGICPVGICPVCICPGVFVLESIYLCHSEKMYEVYIVGINLPLCVECMCGVGNYYSYSSKCAAIV